MKDAQFYCLLYLVQDRVDIHSLDYMNDVIRIRTSSMTRTCNDTYIFSQMEEWYLISCGNWEMHKVRTYIRRYVLYVYNS